VEGLTCAQIKISIYADKFCGHVVMFSGLIANKNKIRRYEYAKEYSRKKKLHPSSAYLRIRLSLLKKLQPKKGVSRGAFRKISVTILGREDQNFQVLPIPI
jgi:hypothetical protein